MNWRTKNILWGGAVIFLILIILFLLFYFSPPMQNRRFLYDAFNDVPINSENGKCKKANFQMIDSMFDYNPWVTCKFQSTLPAMETIDFYKNELEKEGWKCFDNTFLVGNQIYGRSYYNEKYHISIYFNTNGEVEIYVYERTESLAIDSCEQGDCLYSCRDVYITNPVRTTDEGLRYTMPSVFEIVGN